jgi:hypothetical protein
MRWSTLSSAAVASILVSFAKIKKLHLRRVTFNGPRTAISFISSFSSLEELSLQSVFFEHDSEVTRRDDLVVPPHLRVVRLVLMMDMPQVLSWLHSRDHRSSIHTLELGPLTTTHLAAAGALLRVLGDSLEELDLRLDFHVAPGIVHSVYHDFVVLSPYS